MRQTLASVEGLRHGGGRHRHHESSDGIRDLPRLVVEAGQDTSQPKGVQTGEPESILLCDLVLDEAMGEILCARQARRMGVRLQSMAGTGDGRPHNKADSAEWLHHLAFADDLLLVGRTVAEEITMFEDMVEACRT